MNDTDGFRPKPPILGTCCGIMKYIAYSPRRIMANWVTTDELKNDRSLCFSCNVYEIAVGPSIYVY
jgi:hypothetical protein